MKSGALKKLLLCVAIVAAMAATGCNGGLPVKPDDPDNPDRGLTKEQVVESINANNRKIDSIIYYMSATITSPRYPNGQSCKLTIIYKKPDKLMILLTILNGPTLLRVKTDGEYIDILDTFDTSRPMGRIAKIERLRSLPGEVATFQPGFIAKAVGADELDPAKITMERIEGAYILTMAEPGERIRRITVDSETMLISKQEIYKKLANVDSEPDKALGALEVDVTYLAHNKAYTDDDGQWAMLPTHIVVTVYSGPDKSVLEMKIPSVKKENMRLNSDRRVNIGTGGSWRIENWGGAPVEELDENGQWVAPEPSND